MHRRTLNRRLATYGTSVPKLLGDARFGVAKQLLADTSLSMADIAATLGYSDPSTFTRTFRRWSCMAPSDWRQSRAAPAIMHNG
jgi:AraC-like DNA-binding protein